MLRKIGTIFSLTFIFLITGCFEYEEELVLNRDGSGTLLVHYSKYKDVDINNDSFDLPDEEDEIRQEIEEKWTSGNVELIGLEIREAEKSQEVTFTLEFDDIRDLNDVEQFAESEINFEPGRSCSYQRVITTDSDYDLDDDSTFEEILGSIIEETILDKIKFRFEIQMPYKIDDNNANWVRDEQNAVWRFTATDLVKDDIRMIVKCK